VVVECIHTLELLEWAKADRRVAVWSPTEVRTKIVGKANKRRVQYRVVIFPGYAFVPRSEWSTFLRLVPMKFHAQALDWDAIGRPKTCTLAELQVMDTALKSEEDELPEALVGEQPVGLRVIVAYGPFAGQEGVVVDGKRKDHVRLSIGRKYVSLPHKLLKRA
jgi:transcription antitermination factor NusG